VVQIVQKSRGGSGGAGGVIAGVETENIIIYKSKKIENPCKRGRGCQGREYNGRPDKHRSPQGKGDDLLTKPRMSRLKKSVEFSAEKLKLRGQKRKGSSGIVKEKTLRARGGKDWSDL